MKTLLIHLSLFFCAYVFSSCEEYSTGFRITDIRVQRIELSGNQYEDTCLYMFYADCKFSKSYRFFRWHVTPYTENGCEDIINDIVIEDSLHNSIHKDTRIMNYYNGKHFTQLYIDKIDNSSSFHLFIDALDSWEDVRSLFQIGGPDMFDDQVRVFCIPKNAPTPAYFRLIFSDHELKVKINNDPVVYKVKDVVP